MKLSVLIFTLNGSEKLSSILPGIRAVADDLVIGVDDTTTDDSVAIARKYADTVYSVGHAGMAVAKEGELNVVEEGMARCKGDWVLLIDHDETLSPHWADKTFVQALLQDRYATHYWIPRRWIVPPGDRFISSRHWYPDYQLRLIRNLPSVVRFPMLPHQIYTVAGEGRRITRGWIAHWDLVWHNRNVRESKIASYREWSPYTGAEFYRYEDYQYETRPLDYIPPEPLTVAQSVTGKRFDVAMEVLEQPSTMYTGDLAGILIAITNRSDRTLTVAAEFIRSANVSLSYHWHSAGEPPVLHQWEGLRSPLPNNLKPGQMTEAYLAVKVPPIAGNYLLQLDLVEEGVDWYSHHCRTPSIPVTVIRSK